MNRPSLMRKRRTSLVGGRGGLREPLELGEGVEEGQCVLEGEGEKGKRMWIGTDRSRRGGGVK